MPNPLTIVGAPSSAGAYAPGQEKAPAALRGVGLIDYISKQGIKVEDRGDVPGFRWRADRIHPRAMNAAMAVDVARATANQVTAAFSRQSPVLVLGGDCTVELGTVAGALAGTQSVGLVYIDLDTDLNTPESTTDGALDWMGVAHMLGIEGTVPSLAELGPHAPMLRPEQLLFFGHDNVTPFERKIIDERRIAEVRLAEIVRDPAGAAHRVVDGWARRFDRLIIHLDVDVLDYLDFPLAENTRRKIGLQFHQLVASLHPLLSAPNWMGLTVCEINPDHGEPDGSTLRAFAEALAQALARSPRLRNG
jgi:arginase